MRSDCVLSSGRSTLRWAMLHDDSSVFMGHRPPPEQVPHDPFPAHRVWSGCMASAASAHADPGDIDMKHGQKQCCHIMSLQCKAGLGWRISPAKKPKPLPFIRILAAWWAERLRSKRWEETTSSAPLSVCPYTLVVRACSRVGRFTLWGTRALLGQQWIMLGLTRKSLAIFHRLMCKHSCSAKVHK